MKINIELGKEMCNLILEKCGYTSEEVTLYLDPMGDVRTNEVNPEDLHGVKKVVCYPKCRRPKVLDEEYPLIEDCLDILYDTVVERLFNKWLFNMMLEHRPY